jgi:diketogulonate reductase-like aldo/keto reductase
MSLPKTFTIKAAGGKTLEIPSIGFGTWASGSFLLKDSMRYIIDNCVGNTGWAKDATLEALRAGYRHLDCAWMYGVSYPTTLLSGHETKARPPLTLLTG